MKFLVDNQLPAAVARAISAAGAQACHVLGLGLASADDATVWQYACRNGFILISKDEDFFHLANRPGERGLLLWIRIGNCRKQRLLDEVVPRIGDVLAFFGSGHRIIELRPLRQ